ncbi:DNA cross-link repair 1A protein isoform X2 [Tripterygium wilfordii]|uniref:DNA cross-link repair 1A protein isoform X2 n=1 Tax=Tripterygium wilfordii TaxID=458696 RepID=UPI0018F7FEA5|nr:DNA cross-link repair 1A protein isoform X2 [Tripterygium wilfordii]
MPSKVSQSQLVSLSFNDEDDFQTPLTQTPRATSTSASSARHRSSSISLTNHLKPSANLHRSSKTPKRLRSGKENVAPTNVDVLDFKFEEDCSLDSIPSSIDFTARDGNLDNMVVGDDDGKKGLEMDRGYLRNSIESRLMQRQEVDSGSITGQGGLSEDDTLRDFKGSTQNAELDVLLKLCAEDDSSGACIDQQEDNSGESVRDGGGDRGLVQCPLCGIDISDFSDEMRQVHTNDCLDKNENQAQNAVLPVDVKAPEIQQQVVDNSVESPRQLADVSPTINWLRNLGLERYEEAFVQEEIDWDTLQWLTEEDLLSLGITALGPRKKIVHALSELRKGCAHAVWTHMDTHASDRKKSCTTSGEQRRLNRCSSDSARKHAVRKPAKNRKLKDIPSWCCIPGTPFRVDAFKFLRGDCSHWFLTHFHMDHYQGLTKSFCHGKIYCSLITARLVNMKIGIPWDRLQVLPLNQKISIAEINVTCLDANHCPGAIIILFEPRNGKAVLHTGDFRFSEEMASMSLLRTCPVDTVILDTTYCDPQYDFPKQEAVIQFVIDAIQAEAFNPKTLFLIGSYTIGKERLFLEVARVLRRKVYVPAAKFRLLECLGFSEEDMLWFTLNELESHIHVVPMWTLASFKRLKHISNQYVNRFSLIVAFSPTGWTFGKGKKKSPGRRWQQGTMIRYEVPYSEHCSFSELREFVKMVSPEKIIPSVNNDGPESADTMVSLLLS